MGFVLTGFLLCAVCQDGAVLVRLGCPERDCTCESTGMVREVVEANLVLLTLLALVVWNGQEAHGGWCVAQ